MDKRFIQATQDYFKMIGQEVPTAQQMQTHAIFKTNIKKLGADVFEQSTRMGEIPKKPKARTRRRTGR